VCSKCSKDSIDYKFVAFGLTEQKLQIYYESKGLIQICQWIQKEPIKIIGFIDPLDSTHPKDSNEVLFAIFLVTDQKL
jgi:hypothetical protein